MIARSDTQGRLSADGRSAAAFDAFGAELPGEPGAGTQQAVQVRTEDREIVAQRVGAGAVGSDPDHPYAEAIKAGSSDDDHGRDSRCSWEDSR